MEVQYHVGATVRCTVHHAPPTSKKKKKETKKMLKSTIQEQPPSNKTTFAKTMNGPKPPIDTKIYYHLVGMTVSPSPD